MADNKPQPPQGGQPGKPEDSTRTDELVKKLRAGGKPVSGGKQGEEATGANLQALLTQAADEIERLQADAKRQADPGAKPKQP